MAPTQKKRTKLTANEFATLCGQFGAELYAKAHAVHGYGFRYPSTVPMDADAATIERARHDEREIVFDGGEL